jgi:glyoxylase-like metal-dependent hydrolase (beta-lactamase superfamily II)
MKEINSHFFYCEADDKVPCAKIFLVAGEKSSLLIDLGNIPSHLEETLKFAKERGCTEISSAILTHFHDDHCANLTLLNPTIRVLASKNTARYFQREIEIVSAPMQLDLGGVSVELVPVPSLHAKGCLDVLVDRLLLVGDSLYFRFEKDGLPFYNPQIAFEMLKAYESLDFDFAISSHGGDEKEPRAEVLSYLQHLLKNGITSDMLL